jgi:hypothetical protein
MDHLEFREHKDMVLEKIQFYSKTYCSLLPDINTNVYFDETAKSMVLNLRAIILGRELGEVRLPANWWEAFKERFFPEFLRKYFPVKYRVITYKSLYPYLRLPNQKHSIFKAKKIIEENREVV